MSKVIFHVPHDGNDFPKELLDSIIIPYDEFLKQHNHISDKHVSNLIPEGYEVIKFPISRLLCDVDRFLDDSEPMLKFGMGFCYEYVYDGTKIKNINQDILDKTLKHYNKHHKLLNDAVAPNEDVFIIDLHSFERDLIIKETLSSNTDRYPDFCIGYDKGFCSEETILNVVEIISNYGYSVDTQFLLTIHSRVVSFLIKY